MLTTMGIAESIDFAELAGLCQAWANWRKEQTDYDKGSGHIYRVSCAWKAFQSLASNYGFSPADRAKLATQKPDEPDEFDKLMSAMNRRN